MTELELPPVGPPTRVTKTLDRGAPNVTHLAALHALPSSPMCPHSLSPYVLLRRVYTTRWRPRVLIQNLFPVPPLSGIYINLFRLFLSSFGYSRAKKTQLQLEQEGEEERPRFQRKQLTGKWRLSWIYRRGSGFIRPMRSWWTTTWSRNVLPRIFRFPSSKRLIFTNSIHGSYLVRLGFLILYHLNQIGFIWVFVWRCVLEWVLVNHSFPNYTICFNFLN